MFHTEIIGTKSRSLNVFLCGENAVKYLFAKNSEKTDVLVVEGVMGYYDGLGYDESFSSCTISKFTRTPAVLVINGKGMSLSIVAMIKGYTDFLTNNIKGVIINEFCKKVCVKMQRNGKFVSSLLTPKQYS